MSCYGVVAVLSEICKKLYVSYTRTTNQNLGSSAELKHSDAFVLQEVASPKTTVVFHVVGKREKKRPLAGAAGSPWAFPPPGLSRMTALPLVRVDVFIFAKLGLTERH